MNEVTTPNGVTNFDAVITDLKWLVGLGQRARVSDVAQLHQAAIRVLEAAGKVDKTRAIEGCLQSVDEYLGVDGDETWDAIKALLSALPDEPKGKRDE
jgi:hypothetical protein